MTRTITCDRVVLPGTLSRASRDGACSSSQRKEGAVAQSAFAPYGSIDGDGLPCQCCCVQLMLKFVMMNVVPQSVDRHCGAIKFHEWLDRKRSQSGRLTTREFVSQTTRSFQETWTGRLQVFSTNLG